MQGFFEFQKKEKYRKFLIKTPVAFIITDSKEFPVEKAYQAFQTLYLDFEVRKSDFDLIIEPSQDVLDSLTHRKIFATVSCKGIRLPHHFFAGMDPSFPVPVKIYYKVFV